MIDQMRARIHNLAVPTPTWRPSSQPKLPELIDAWPSSWQPHVVVVAPRRPVLMSLALVRRAKLGGVAAQPDRLPVRGRPPIPNGLVWTFYR